MASLRDLFDQMKKSVGPLWGKVAGAAVLCWC